MDGSQPDKVPLNRYNVKITSAFVPPTILAPDLTPHEQPWLQETEVEGNSVTARSSVDFERSVEEWRLQDFEPASKTSISFTVC